MMSAGPVEERDFAKSVKATRFVRNVRANGNVAIVQRNPDTVLPVTARVEALACSVKENGNAKVVELPANAPTAMTVSAQNVTEARR